MKPTITLIFSLLISSVISLTGSAQDGSSGSSFSSGDSSQGAQVRSSGIGMVVGENYVLKPSDVISIEVYQEDDLDKMVRVEGDGSVALSLVGKVKIAGMTVAESQSLITDLYNRDFLVDPQISITVTSFSAKVVRILGSVNRPGVVEIPPDHRLVGDVLLEEAERVSADLLVMGAYSHSRLRELILGGVTRHVLQNADLPVLMAH